MLDKVNKEYGIGISLNQKIKKEMMYKVRRNFLILQPIF